MPIEIAEALAAITVIIAIGGMVLTGFRMRMGHRERMAQLEAGGRDDGKDEILDTLRHQVDTLSEEVTELNERMDFTERLLTQGRPEGAKRGGVTTPV